MNLVGSIGVRFTSRGMRDSFQLGMRDEG